MPRLIVQFLFHFHFFFIHFLTNVLYIWLCLENTRLCIDYPVESCKIKVFLFDIRVSKILQGAIVNGLHFFIIYERITIYVLRLKIRCRYDHYSQSYYLVSIQCAF